MSKRRAPVLLAGRVFSVLRRRQARVVLLLDGVATLLQQWHAANEVHVGCYRVISLSCAWQIGSSPHLQDLHCWISGTTEGMTPVFQIGTAKCPEICASNGVVL